MSEFIADFTKLIDVFYAHRERLLGKHGDRETTKRKAFEEINTLLAKKSLCDIPYLCKGC